MPSVGRGVIAYTAIGGVLLAAIAAWCVWVVVSTSGLRARIDDGKNLAEETGWTVASALPVLRGIAAGIALYRRYGELPAPALDPARLPAALEPLLRRCLAVDPQLRPAAAELVVALASGDLSG